MFILKILKVSFILSLISIMKVIAQPSSTGINTSTPNIKAALEIKNTEGFSQGLIIPRLPSTVISTWTGLDIADQGLIFYGTGAGADSIYYWTGTKWLSLATNDAKSKDIWSVSGTKIYYNTGNVGIGNRDPLSLLDLYNINPQANTISDIIHLQQSSSSVARVGLGAAISFSNQLASGAMALSGRMSSVLENATDGSATAGILFQTLSNQSGNINNSLYISGDGNIGIGTTTPLTSLQVNGGLTLTPGTSRYYNSFVSNLSIGDETYIRLITEVTTTTFNNVADGQTIGQVVVIENQGASGSFYFLYINNSKPGEHVELGPGQVLTLIWNGSDWIKVSGDLNKTIAFSASSDSENQPLPNSPTKINFGIENYDEGGDNYNFGSSRFTVPPSGNGLYHFDASYTIGPGLTADNAITMSLYVNKVEVKNITGRTNSDKFSLSLSCDIKLVEAEYVEVYIFQQTNQTIITQCPAPCLNYFNGRKVY